MHREVVTYNGKRFNRYPDASRYSDRMYFKCSGLILHRLIWEAANGPIPPGMEIHHRDENPGNNELSNLELLTHPEHAKRHSGVCSERKREHLEQIRPLTAEWHGSDAGRAWHSEHGIDAWSKREPRTVNCAQCGNQFTTITIQSHARFCSNNCKSAWRKASGVDDIQAMCPRCGTTFTKNKYSVQRFCSRACGSKARFE